MGEHSATDRRPSPDALLREAGKTLRGRLKIFLGAAPGVGKTYEMLSAAQTRTRAASDATLADVVIGVVETHGRAETEALTVGLEMVPRRTIAYRGQTLTEMDLDAILARRPHLVLVDELAHSNAPGSRHPKRYMDVEELLSAGVDVYTTLNIQHVESLNDVVARITRIRVRETIPDSVIERADDIELIDLTPEDLIQRLKDGKVYVPAQAERAVRHYFAPGNLTALRELALRRTAQRVDNQMVDYMRSHAIDGPWPAGERVLVCIQGGQRATATVRHAKRLADQFRAPWSAISVETARSGRNPVAEQGSVVEALRLAQQLGGEPVLIPGQDVVDSIIDYARANNVTHIIIGKSDRPRWRQMVSGSVTQRMINRAGGINIHIIEAPVERAGSAVPTRDEKPSADVRPYIIATAVVALTTAVAMGLHTMGITNVALVFLTAILIDAVLFGLGPSLLACLASVMAYNFFFLPPLYTFTIAEPENVVALFFFAVVALVASNLAARVRGQAVSARVRARTTDDLYQFSRKLTVAVTLDDLLWATAHQIALMLKVRVVLLLPEADPKGDGANGSIAVRAGFPPEDVLDDADLAAAKWSWEKNHVAGRGSDTLPGAKWLFLPMRTGRGPLGVVGIIRDEPGPLLTPDQQRLLDSLADQAALAIERVNLARDLHSARLQVETDRLRSALLTSISHDLRTPLASILGSATSLRSQHVMLDTETRDSLLGTIIEEADRLNRFIGNLLDMTRLESGALHPRGGLNVLSDVIGAALQRAAKILADHRIEVDLPANLPMLALDMVLFEQVLFNLLDNAAKYAPAGSLVRLEAVRTGDTVTLRIIDEGAGIPAADLEPIFEKFYRAKGPDRGRAGTGLGLAICRGFVEAMGGTVVAANRSDRSGAVFAITLPVPTGAPLVNLPLPEETIPNG
ncbi:DUF4118 domain-containing protein [Rhodopila sp.]|uniref:DUF4118 domain-containing protein n=1 Tax=Rhodopila sp. TaxID=2480087 RepID=UPI003D14CC37